MCQFQLLHGTPRGAISHASLPSQPQPTVRNRHQETAFIYIYDLPLKSNEEAASLQPPWHSEVYDYEIVLHKHLLTSHLRTHDPGSARLFYIPLYLSRILDWKAQNLLRQVSRTNSGV